MHLLKISSHFRDQSLSRNQTAPTAAFSSLGRTKRCGGSGLVTRLDRSQNRFYDRSQADLILEIRLKIIINCRNRLPLTKDARIMY